MNFSILHKIKITILVLLLPIIIFSQKYNLNNTLGFNYIDNSKKTYNGSINSTTNIELGKISINNNLNHDISYSSKLISNEFSNKLIIPYSNKNNSAFTTIQTTYSLTRDLNLDNLIGIGYGRRDTIIGFKINYSYAILWQRINNKDISYIRHSFRLKIVRELQKLTFTSEYYYQPVINGGENVIIYGTTKISYRIATNLAITATDVYNYYGIQKVKTIHTFTFGLTYFKNK